MGQARIGAVVATMFVLLLSSEIADAATYTVGDEKGWTFGVSEWANDKQFVAGDTLVFNYDSKGHNVVEVDEKSYNDCVLPKSGCKPHRTGLDRIVLKPGKNFFICSLPGHCADGMKIAANCPA